MNVLDQLKNSVKSTWLKVTVGFHLLYIETVHAQLDNLRLPSSDDAPVPGVNEDSSVVDMVIGVAKLVATVAIWLIVIVAGLSLLKNIIKSVNRVMDSKNNEGGAKWGEVIGDIIANVAILMLILLAAIWLQTYL